MRSRLPLPQDSYKPGEDSGHSAHVLEALASAGAGVGGGLIVEAPGGKKEARCAALEELLGSALLLTGSTFALVLGAVVECVRSLTRKMNNDLRG